MLLQLINTISKSLRAIECTIIKGLKLLNFQKIKKSKLEFDKIENKAEMFCIEKKIKLYDTRKSLGMVTQLTAKFFETINVFYAICDNLIEVITRRKESYENVTNNFFHST